VVYEVLRIHANTGVMLEHVVPHPDHTIDDHWLPGGTTVGVNVWIVHRNKEIFGPNIDIFKPDRWLANSGERFSEMKRNIFSVCKFSSKQTTCTDPNQFGVGTRRCIGFNVALALSSKLIVEFIQRLDMTLSNLLTYYVAYGLRIVRKLGARK
jgi:cytochrome P450